MKMYDDLRVLYADKDFAVLFIAGCGQSAISLGKLDYK